MLAPSGLLFVEEKSFAAFKLVMLPFCIQSRFPVRLPPFGGAKKTREPLVKSMQKDQAKKIIKIPHAVSESQE